MSRLKIPNWTSLQHYKNRRPSWIKLHAELLDNPKFMRLPMAAKAIKPLLELLASESDDGTLDADTAIIAWRLRMTEAEVAEALAPLLDAGFIERCDGDASTALAGCYQGASTMLAGCYQDASPEERRERGEQRTREPSVHAASSTDLIEKPSSKKQAHQVERPPNVEPEVWADFVQHRKAIKAPLTQTALKGIENEAQKASITLNNCLQEICLRGWRSFKAEWMLKTNGQSSTLNLGDYS